MPNWNPTDPCKPATSANGSFECLDLRRLNDTLVLILCSYVDEIASETGGRALRAQLLLIEEQVLNKDKYSLDVLFPKDQTEFISLRQIIFSNQV